MLCSSGDQRVLHSFPTRRSSDLLLINTWIDVYLDARAEEVKKLTSNTQRIVEDELEGLADKVNSARVALEDRKSTRLNSSHGYISYAAFCLKKKKRNASTRSGTR